MWIATIPFIFLFFFFYDIAYVPLLVAYVVEILPFKIRSRGVAVMVSEELPAPNHRLVSMEWSMFTSSFLELDSVSRPRIQPIRDPLGPRCHGVEIREFLLPQFRRGSS